MFGIKKKNPPTTPFDHSADCKIMKADPTTEIKWSETRTGFWEARCQCGVQYYQEPASDERERLDPLDPKNARHSPTCEYVAETDPTLLRAILRVRDGANSTYSYVQCSSCDHGWQVPHFVQPPMKVMAPPKPSEFPKVPR
jgi:hypothetical protein